VLTQLERHREAFEDAKRAILKRPEIDNCFVRAAYAAGKIEDWKEIIALLTVVLEAQPDIGEAYNQRGWAYYSSGRPDLAFQDYMAGAKLDHPGSEAQLARAYYNGSGVAKDRQQSLFWARKAAAQGEPTSQAMVEQMTRELTRK
jgi:TPR repeat protein